MEEAEAAREAALLTSQRTVYDTVLEAIKHVEGKCIFVDAPGGTGKTFTFNAILAAIRCQCEIALAVASSGIAAILLDLGRTFHSRFKASRRPAEGQTLDISAQTALAKLIRRAKVIIWDEAAMANRYHLEALNLTTNQWVATIASRVQTLQAENESLRRRLLRATAKLRTYQPHPGRQQHPFSRAGAGG